MRALVGADSRAMRAILSGILKELGFEASSAAHGQEALDKLAAEGKPELILLDWNMPVMDGYQFLVELRRRPEYSDIAVVMVTTEAEMEHMVKALEAGANEYVMKPFTKDVIAEKLAILGLT
ncbi:MAG: response regulator [Candidatus Eisenbacteria bacterium]